MTTVSVLRTCPIISLTHTYFPLGDCPSTSTSIFACRISASYSLLTFTILSILFCGLCTLAPCTLNISQLFVFCRSEHSLYFWKRDSNGLTLAEFLDSPLVPTSLPQNASLHWLKQAACTVITACTCFCNFSVELIFMIMSHQKAKSLSRGAMSSSCQSTWHIFGMW